MVYGSNDWICSCTVELLLRNCLLTIMLLCFALNVKKRHFVIFVKKLLSFLIVPRGLSIDLINSFNQFGETSGNSRYFAKLFKFSHPQHNTIRLPTVIPKTDLRNKDSFFKTYHDCIHSLQQVFLFAAFFWLTIQRLSWCSNYFPSAGTFLLSAKPGSS